VVAFAFALLVAAGPALAQTDQEDVRRRLELERLNSQRQLTDSDKRARDIQSDLAAMREEREQINAQLLQTAKLIQATEGQMSAIEQRLGELEAQEKHVRGSLDARRGSMSGLLAAMQRMGRNPPPVMITKREDALSMVRSAMLLAAAFPELRAQAQLLSDQLNDLVRVMTGIKTEGEKLKAETQRLNEARVRLASLMETKRQSLTERQEELAQVRRAAAEISRNVGDLNELIVKLDKSIAENTRLGAYERQLEAEAQKQAALDPKPALPTPAPPAQPGRPVAEPTPAPTPKAPPAEPKSPAAILAPGDKLAMATPGRIQPAVPFHLAKGRLPLPAQGRRVLNYGDRTQRGTSDGIVIETRFGAQITSPTDGWIMYAGPYLSYGHILIISAGGGYHILLAGLTNTDVQVGQFVLAGEPIGTMPAAARAAAGRSQDSAPVLYVEFRKDQKPVNPDPWWADNTRKVQG
jgi:septal ring factor EnvC (AmiA/AmiB activator)